MFGFWVDPTSGNNICWLTNARKSLEAQDFRAFSNMIIRHLQSFAKYALKQEANDMFQLKKEN